MHIGAEASRKRGREICVAFHSFASRAASRFGCFAGLSGVAVGVAVGVAADAAAAIDKI